MAIMDWQFVFSLLMFFANTMSLPLDREDITEVTEGVFMYPERGDYKYTADAAKDACRSQNAELATKEQVERAHQQGLETCRFGWTDGQVAVIPRIVANPKCGRGQTGVLVWNNAAPTKLFAAFCFRSSVYAVLNQTQTMTTGSVLSLTSKPTTTRLPAQAHASPAVTPSVSTTTKPPASVPTTSPPPGWTLAPVTAPSPPTLASKPSPAATSSPISPAASPTGTSASSTSEPSLLSRLLTSVPASSFSSSSSSSLTVLSSASLSPLITPSPPVGRNHTTTSSTTLQTVSPTDSSPGGSPTALIVLAVIGLLILLTAAAGAVWYFKVKRQVFPFWSWRQHDTERETWKQVDLDLHGDQEVEEERDKKFSDDITTFSDNKTISS